MEDKVKNLILEEVKKILAREEKRQESAIRYQRPFDASVRQSALVIERLLVE